MRIAFGGLVVYNHCALWRPHPDRRRFLRYWFYQLWHVLTTR